MSPSFGIKRRPQTFQVNNTIRKAAHPKNHRIANCEFIIFLRISLYDLGLELARVPRVPGTR